MIPPAGNERSLPLSPEAGDALAARLVTALRHHPHLRRQPLHFEAEQGRVVLRGHVGSYFHKQMAQEAVRGMAGVDEIDNQLEVTWPEPVEVD